MITLRASYKLSIEPPIVTRTYPRRDSMLERHEVSERSGTGRGTSERPVHTTPYGTAPPPQPPEAPVGEVRVDPNMDDEVFTAFTPVSNESDPLEREYTRSGSRRRRRRDDDDTITREKKANAMDVD